MKKMLLLPLIAVAGLVSMAWAAPCKVDGANIFCQYESGCWQLKSTDNDGNEIGCETQASYCSGGLYSGGTEGTGTCSSRSGMSSFTCNGCTYSTGSSVWCDYGPVQSDGSGGCWEKETAAICEADYGTVVSSCGAAPSSSSAGTTPSSSSQQQVPILLGASTSASLMVLVQSSDLYISSVKAARLSLFDMSGKEVLNQNVQAGYSKLSLDGQKQGVYFAVVSSGSSKQTVRVVLK